MTDDKTTIQITKDLKKEIKIICAKKGITYEEYLKKVVEKENGRRNT